MNNGVAGDLGCYDTSYGIIVWERDLIKNKDTNRLQTEYFFSTRISATIMMTKDSHPMKI